MKKKCVFLAAMALSVQPPVQAATPSLSSAASAANYIMKGMNLNSLVPFTQNMLSAATYTLKGMDYVLDGVDGLLPTWMPKGREVMKKYVVDPLNDSVGNMGSLCVVGALAASLVPIMALDPMVEATIGQLAHQDQWGAFTALSAARIVYTLATAYVAASGISSLVKHTEVLNQYMMDWSAALNTPSGLPEFSKDSAPTKRQKPSDIEA